MLAIAVARIRDTVPRIETFVRGVLTWSACFSVSDATFLDSSPQDRAVDNARTMCTDLAHTRVLCEEVDLILADKAADRPSEPRGGGRATRSERTGRGSRCCPGLLDPGDHDLD